MRVETGVPMGDWRSVAEAARTAEQLGYDGIVSYEIQNDPFLPLGFAACATERVRLGTAIVVAFPRSPAILAYIAWDLAKYSKGRAVVGLGTQVNSHFQ